MLPINLPPAIPGAINGDVSGVCTGPKTYSIALVEFATSYTWTVPTGVTIRSGQNTNSISITFSSKFVSGYICVKAVNACGSSTERCLFIKGIPEKPGAITGPAAVCYKQTNVRYTISPVAGAKTYTWEVPYQATIVSGQGTTSILVKFASTSGEVSVRAGNDCGTTTNVNKAVAVNNCSNTVKPSGRVGTLVTSGQLELDVISSAGNVSKTNSMQIDWTLGEPCIETIASSKGMYTQGFHQPMAVISKVTTVTGTKLKISAAPNPVSTRLRVSFEAEKEASVMLSLRDATGKIVFKKAVLTSDKNIEINMVGFSQGLYILNVHALSGELLENFKIVKMN
jgi:hypothetical protein